MTRRNFFIISGAVILVIFIIGLTALAPTLKRGRDSFVNTNTSDSESGPKDAGTTPRDTNINTDTRVYTKDPASQAVLLAIASTFAEKYGSFSSEGDFENLIDAKVFMSDRMKQETDDTLAKNQNVKSSEFYGITTRTIKPQILTLDSQESRAQVLVNTQQEEFSGEVSSRGKITYKKLILDFIKINNEWKVDAAVWQ